MSDPERRKRLLFFAVFTVSGFSGLIYESIWSHYLKLFLGHAAYAQTLVLAIFMGGMAIGSWIMAKRSARMVNLLLGYAIVEGVIGVLGLLFHKVSIGVTSLAFESLLPAIDSVVGVQLMKWSLGALLILPQSILLGMTFPLMSGAIVRRFPQRSGETLAMLYFTNSIGAAIGVMVSGFVLIGLVGLPGTIMSAGLLNLLLALLVWAIAKKEPDKAPPLQVERGIEDKSVVSPAIVRWILIGAAVTGAASFLYEIAWIRMLSLVLGSSTHAFEMMLSAFILGIALGGLWIHRRIDTLADPVRFLSTVLLIMATVAVVSLPIYNGTFDLMGNIVRMFRHSPQGYVGIMVSSHVIAMLVMIPTTFFCGMTLPIMTTVLLRTSRGESSIGAIYAWNTAGAIVGVIGAVHVLMPWVGLKGVVIGGAALQVALAVVFRFVGAERTRAFGNVLKPALAGVALLAVAALFVQIDARKMIAGVFRDGVVSIPAEDKILFYGHGKTASISLRQSGQFVSIATNGKPDASINMAPAARPRSDEITQVLLGALPMAFHPHPRHVANIGFGSGMTSNVVLANPQVESLDTIEIEPTMVHAARLGFMPRVARTFEDPRSHIVFEDAKTFFAAHRKKYDVIVSEPSNPWVSGVSSLFSAEFYRQVTRYLEPDGMLVQWVQTYEVDLDIVLSIMRAMEPSFADFAVYNANRGDIIIVASRSGRVGAPNANLFSAEAMRNELTRVYVRNVEDIRRRYLGNREILMPLVQASGVPANSDYFPYVDLYAARARILHRDALEYNALRNLPVTFFELLQPSTEPGDATLHPVSWQGTTSTTAVKTTREHRYEESVRFHAALSQSHLDGMSADATSSALTLLSSTEQCATSNVVHAWLAAAYTVAQTSSAVMSPDEATRLWDSMASTPCGRRLAGNDLQWFRFLRANAELDRAQIASIGAALLKADYKFASDNYNAYMVLAIATSALAIDQPALALDVVRSHARSAGADPSSQLAYRWVATLALQKLKERRTTPPRVATDKTRH